MTRTTLLLAILLASAPAAVAGDATTRAFNAEVQDAWTRMRPIAEQELRRQAQLQVGPITREPKLEVDLEAIRRIDLSVDRAPGLTAFSDAGLSLRVPVEGTWRVEVAGDVKVRWKALGKWWQLRLPVEVEVKELAASADAAFDWSDPTRPKVARIGTPKLVFKVRVRTPGKILTDLLVRALSPLGSVIARRMAAKSLDALTPQLDALKAQFPGKVPAEGAPLLVDSGSTVPVGAIALGVDRKIATYHVPHGIILPMHMDVPSTDTWAQAYGPNGTGNPGVATPHGDGGDSSAWNGHYMASQAFRHAITGDADALASVRLCLQAFEDMLALHGDTGLMCRVAAPETSPMGQKIIASNSPAAIVRGVRRGVPYVGTNGDKGDSRDVYIEIVFGLAVVHDFVPEPSVRARAKAMLTSMVGYLVARKWWIDEDRAPMNLANPATSTFPTFWLGVPSQKVAMLVAAARLDPQRFGPELQREGPLAKMAWLSQWTGTFSLDDYFGFSLSHVAYFTHLRQETDPDRWRDMNRAYRVMRRYVGHHRNAYFDAIHVAIDPADAAYKGAVKEELVRFVTRPHRKVAPATFDPTKITYAPFTFATTGYNPNGTVTGPATVQLPTEPLSPEQRAPEDDFVWQRSPFSPYAGPGQGDPYTESTGLDLTAPYWLGRYHGVSFP